MGDEETIDDVKQAYALLFKAHGELREERDELASRVKALEGALKECSAVCAGETMSKQGLINALEKARAALTASKGQP